MQLMLGLEQVVDDVRGEVRLHILLSEFDHKPLNLLADLVVVKDEGLLLQLLLRGLYQEAAVFDRSEEVVALVFVVDFHVLLLLLIVIRNSYIGQSLS